MQKHSIARAVSGARWNPRDGLIGSDQGLWLDPSDITTMFQDAAGTTPVTAVEQPVGKILDKSGRGNHATNPSGNSANFPVLSARYNLLTKTEALTDAAWTKTTGVVVTDNAALAPDGTMTAATIAFGALSREVAQSFTATVGVTTPAFYVKGTAGQVLNFGSPGQDKLITLTGGWDLAKTTLTAGIIRLYIGNYAGTANALNIAVWHPDLRFTNTGVNLPPYQRVNTATDYDSDPTKFPRQIKYSSGQSLTVNFPSSLGSDCVIARADPGVSAVIAENQTFNTPLTLNTSHSGLVITSRDISVDEKARLDEYLDKKSIAK